MLKTTGAARLLPRFSRIPALRPSITLSPAFSRHVSVHIPSSPSRSRSRQSTSNPNPNSNPNSNPNPTNSFKNASNGHLESVNSFLLELRDALISKDLESSWTAWNLIIRDGHSDRIYYKDHAALIDLLQNSLSSLPQSQRDMWLNTRCHQCASSATNTPHIAAVKQWAKFFIVYNRPEMVQTLINECFKPSPIRENDVEQQNQNPDQTSGTTDVVSTPPPSIPSQPNTNSPSESTPKDTNTPEGRLGIFMHAVHESELHDLLAYLIIAKSLQDDLPGLVATLETAIFGSSFPNYFQEDRVIKLYKSLEIKPKAKNSSTAPTNEQAQADATTDPSHDQIKERILRFCRNAELSRGISTGLGGPQKIPLMLGRLFGSRKIELAWKIFSTAMDASVGNQAWLPIEDQSGSIKGPPCDTIRAAWTQNCWSICLSNFLAAGRVEWALKVWSTYHQRGFRPDHRIWNALLDGYSRAGNFDAVYKTWKEVVTRSKASGASSNNPEFQPDVVMFTTMISALFKDGKPDQAMAIFAEMKERHASSSDPLRISTETYNAVMHGLFVTGRSAKALALLSQMREHGPQPTIVTINTILRAQGRIGDLAGVANSIRMIDQLKLNPDIVTLTTILDTLLRKAGSSAADAVVGVLKLMDSLNVKANAVTYTALIKASLAGAEASNIDLAAQMMPGCHLKANQTANGTSGPRFDAALALLDRMIDLKIEPTEVTYSALISACVQYPGSVAEAAAQGRIPAPYLSGPEPLVELGETPDTIDGWRRNAPAVILALNLLEQMRRRGLSPNMTTFNYLIVGLASPGTGRASFLRALSIMDDVVHSVKRVFNADERQGPGPFISSILQDEYRPGKIAGFSNMALGHTSWVVILTTLCDRLAGYSVDPESHQDCLRALKTALSLVKESGAESYRGTDGGKTLARIVERSAMLVQSM